MLEPHVRHTILITVEQKAWLKAHEEFNLSGWIRPRLTKLIKDYTFMMGLD